MAIHWWVAIVSFLFLAPGILTMGIGFILMTPIALLQLKRAKEPTQSVLFRVPLESHFLNEFDPQHSPTTFVDCYRDYYTF